LDRKKDFEAPAPIELANLPSIDCAAAMSISQPASGPACTFAIGDIHGCKAPLCRLLDACNGWGGDCQRRFVFLGDYIDRGPESAAVIGKLMSWQEQRPDQVVCLRGNHEDMLLLAQHSSTAYMQWISNGGSSTLRSFGAATVKDIPKNVVSWLHRLPRSFDDGRRFYVHAGVDLRVALDQQLVHDLLWMREPFLTLADSMDPGRLIVHGHTPTHTRRPDLRRYRLNLDTGAFMGGPLTAAVFSDSQTGPICFIADSGDIQVL
jgi:serine/threonine protein phosphatase 1